MKIKWIENVVFTIVVVLACSGISYWLDNHGHTSNQREYNKMLKEWNDDVAHGKMRARINEEILVYKQLGCFAYYSNFKKDEEFYYMEMTSNPEYMEVILIDTYYRRIIRAYIKTDLIRYPESNWGLSQDVWKLDERVAKIEKGETKIANNPFKIIKKKKGGKK